MATPAYLGASAGYPANAGAITQFTGAHNSQWLYSPALVSAQATGSGTYQSLASSPYYAQRFTTGSAQSAIGQVALQISAVGGSPVTAAINPLTIALYAVNAGAPTGSALATSQVIEPYVYSQPFWCVIPLQATGLTPSTIYALVVSGSGPGSAYYAWQCSNQTSGALTSPDAATWSTVAYGLMYQIHDDSTGAGPVQTIVDDAGARITTLTYSGTTLTGITEYTQTQSGVALVSARTLSYASNGLLKGVG